MKPEPKLLARIGLRPRQPQVEPRPEATPCAWEGCAQEAPSRAPKGTRAVGEFHNFCLEHVRHYNTAFNFFSGMSTDEMEDHLKQTAQTDGRPSWGFGSKPGAGQGPRMPRGKARDPRARPMADPLNVFARYNWQQSKRPQPERQKPIHEPDRRALEALGVQAKDRLRAIIAAYTHLKTRGFVGR